MFHGIWTQIAKQGYFISIEAVVGEEVNLSLLKEPKINLTAVDFPE